MTRGVPQHGNLEGHRVGWFLIFVVHRPRTKKAHQFREAFLVDESTFENNLLPTLVLQCSLALALLLHPAAARPALLCFKLALVFQGQFLQRHVELRPTTVAEGDFAIGRQSPVYVFVGDTIDGQARHHLGRGQGIMRYQTGRQEK